MLTLPLKNSPIFQTLTLHNHNLKHHMQFSKKCENLSYVRSYVRKLRVVFDWNRRSILDSKALSGQLKMFLHHHSFQQVYKIFANKKNKKNNGAHKTVHTSLGAHSAQRSAHMTLGANTSAHTSTHTSSWAHTIACMSACMCVFPPVPYLVY